MSRGVGSCGEVYARLGCHTATSTCRTDADCVDEEPIWCQGDYTPPQCWLLVDDWSCNEPHGCGPCG